MSFKDFARVNVCFPVRFLYGKRLTIRRIPPNQVP